MSLLDDGNIVFKSKSNEAVGLREKVKTGTFYKRERASYIVDRFLELGMVPTTTIKSIDGEIGSAQRFIDDAKTFCETASEERIKCSNEMTKLWTLDYIIWNSDRHDANFLAKDGKIYAIDNGLSFGDDTFRPYKGDALFSFDIPSELKEKMRDVANDEKTLELLEVSLEDYLPKKEIKACIWRIKNVAKILNDERIKKEQKGGPKDTIQQNLLEEMIKYNGN